MTVRLYEKPVLPVADRFIGVVTVRLMNERIKVRTDRNCCCTPPFQKSYVETHFSRCEV